MAIANRLLAISAKSSYAIHYETAAMWRRAMLTDLASPFLYPDSHTPARLAEKTARNDHFFTTVLKEGVVLAQD